MLKRQQQQQSRQQTTSAPSVNIIIKNSSPTMKAFFALFTIFLMIFANVQAVEKSACTLPKDVGPCRKADLKFYYNDEAKKCEEFFYGGCQGNDNRFQTKEECEKLCL